MNKKHKNKILSQTEKCLNKYIENASSAEIKELAIRLNAVSVNKAQTEKIEAAKLAKEKARQRALARRRAKEKTEIKERKIEERKARQQAITDGFNLAFEKIQVF